MNMKHVKWVGILVVVVSVVLALVLAAKTGTKSPIYVEGEVELPDALVQEAVGMSHLFIIVFDQDSPIPMPYGAQRESIDLAKTRKFHFVATKESLRTMDENRPQPKTLRVKVRLDKDGTAGPDQPGDLVGIVENIPWGTEGIVIPLSKEVK